MIKALWISSRATPALPTRSSGVALPFCKIVSCGDHLHNAFTECSRIVTFAENAAHALNFSAGSDSKYNTHNARKNPKKSSITFLPNRRADVFMPSGNKGFNSAHLRNSNNAAADVAFGFENQPGHQADPDRGNYGLGALVGSTFGGVGQIQ